MSVQMQMQLLWAGKSTVHLILSLAVDKSLKYLHFKYYFELL